MELMERSLAEKLQTELQWRSLQRDRREIRNLAQYTTYDITAGQDRFRIGGSDTEGRVRIQRSDTTEYPVQQIHPDRSDQLSEE